MPADFSFRTNSMASTLLAADACCMTAATPFAARMKGDVSNSSAIVDGTVNPPAAVFASAHSSLRAMSVFRGSTNLAYWRLPLVYLTSPC